MVGGVTEDNELHEIHTQAHTNIEDDHELDEVGNLTNRSDIIFSYRTDHRSG